MNAADFFGKRQLEVTRGTNGPAIVVTQPGVWKTIPELEQLVVAQTNRWQLYQDVLDENSNKVFDAYTMLTQSNLERIAELKPPTNSVFVYDNKPLQTHRGVVGQPRASLCQLHTRSDTAWLRTVETPPISDQLQAMVSQVHRRCREFFADEQTFRRARQRGERDFQSEHHHCRRAAAGGELRRHQCAVARAGRGR